MKMTTEKAQEQRPWLRRRLPMLLVLGLALFMWKNGFGYFATERHIEWRLPVSYAEVRQIELQLWRGESLLKREEIVFDEAGISKSLETSLPLSRGEHHAVARVRLKSGQTALFRAAFDPANDSTVLINFVQPPSAVGR